MEGLTGRSHSDREKPRMSRKEKWAAIKAAFAHFGPIFLLVIICFSIAAVLTYLWLH